MCGPGDPTHMFTWHQLWEAQETATQLPSCSRTCKSITTYSPERTWYGHGNRQTTPSEWLLKHNTEQKKPVPKDKHCASLFIWSSKADTAKQCIVEGYRCSSKWNNSTVLKECTKNPAIANKFSKSAHYKIITQKLVVFPNTSSEEPRKEIKKKI